MATVQLDRISKSFGGNHAVAPLTLDVKEGEFFSLLGPSGCGKTTILRIIAGLESPTSGNIIINGVDVTTLTPQERNVGIVFQNYALFPHLTAFANVAYGLEVKKLPKHDIQSRVNRALSTVHLSDKAQTPVPLLSGGEQQRVAVARAVVVEPRVLLFDEPLSNLDYALRLETRAEIKRLQREAGITTIYVTHDQGEALALSDRIAVLSKGLLQQVGTPDELYFRPSNALIASFIGHANLFSPESSKRYFGINNLSQGESLAILPEEVILSTRGGKARGKIVDKQFSGSSVELTVDLHGMSVRAHFPSAGKDAARKIGDEVCIVLGRTKHRTVKHG